MESAEVEKQRRVANKDLELRCLGVRSSLQEDKNVFDVFLSSDNTIHGHIYGVIGRIVINA
jgi:hypothetical protein